MIDKKFQKIFETKNIFILYNIITNFIPQINKKVYNGIYLK